MAKTKPPLKTKYIETPDKMWELFVLYKEFVKANPFIVKDWVGKDAEQVSREKERPLTMEGFECFVMDNSDISYPDLSSYFDGKDESYKSYFHVCSRIKREIRNDQIAGGMAGMYNPSITQRLNGLTEKIDQQHSGEIKGNSILQVEIVPPSKDEE